MHFEYFIYLTSMAKSPLNLPCIWCGRKQEYPHRHRESMQTPQRKAQLAFESGSFLLWGHNANHSTIILSVKSNRQQELCLCIHKKNYFKIFFGKWVLQGVHSGPKYRKKESLSPGPPDSHHQSLLVLLKIYATLNWNLQLTCDVKWSCQSWQWISLPKCSSNLSNSWDFFSLDWKGK